MEIGSKIIYQGQRGQIIGTMAPKLGVIVLDEDNSNTAYAIPMKSIELDAREAFKIGDKVESVLLKNRVGFRGIVTGYEVENNRVVCVPIEERATSRVRYAYKPDELRLSKSKRIVSVTLEFNCGGNYNER